ncbi:MAG: hypothetical protein ACLU37_06055 [Collinsella sp.]
MEHAASALRRSRRLPARPARGHARGTGARGLRRHRGDGLGAGALAEAGAALPVLEDVPAIASGAKIMAPEARSVIEIGGQNAYFVCRLAAAVPEFAMNESCASGTGSFFEDQMTRLGLRIEDFSALVGRAEGHEVHASRGAAPSSPRRTSSTASRRASPWRTFCSASATPW